MKSRRTAWSLTILMVLALIYLGGITPRPANGQIAIRLWFMGFSPATPPADSLAFRQALASAIDRDTIVSAASPYYRGALFPAVGIQHPRLTGYNPDVHGYPYDPERAREFYKQSGWTAPITILVGPTRDDVFANVFRKAIVASLNKVLDVTVEIQHVANFDVLVRAERAGTAAVYMEAWRSGPSDFGYPSFALGIAHDFVFGEDLAFKTLLERRDVRGVEQLLLDKALIVPNRP